jgi:hypothetical protein
MNEKTYNTFSDLKQSLCSKIAESSIKKCENSLGPCFLWGMYEVEIPIEMLKEDQ